MRSAIARLYGERRAGRSEYPWEWPWQCGIVRSPHVRNRLPIIEIRARRSSERGERADRVFLGIVCFGAQVMPAGERIGVNLFPQLPLRPLAIGRKEGG